MILSFDKLKESFPYPTLTPVVGLPDYSTIAAVQKQLNANASSKHSNLGDGLLGYLALTLTVAEYTLLSAFP